MDRPASSSPSTSLSADTSLLFSIKGDEASNDVMFALAVVFVAAVVFSISYSPS